VTIRSLPAFRLAALALLLPASGCLATKATWGAAPTVRPEKLLGARVDDLGRLEIGVELDDGRRIAYREVPPAGSNYVYFLPMAQEPDVDAAKIAWPCTPDPHGDVSIRPTPSVVAGTVDPILECRPGTREEVALRSSGQDSTMTLTIPGTGGISWRRPGTWLCVVATPVTVAFDVVTFPFQAIAWLYVESHL
jgi:hypothetical protein